MWEEKTYFGITIQASFQNMTQQDKKWMFKFIISRDDFWSRNPFSKSGTSKESFLLVEAEYGSSSQIF